MFKFLVKRILFAIPVMLIVVTIIFTLMYFSPGDPVIAILGERATTAQIESMRQEMGLNDPYITQWGRYIFGVFRGDFGKSYKSKRPVMDEILARFPYTLKLAITSSCLAIIIGVTAGIVSAVRQYSFLDKFLTLFTLIGLSSPSFWTAMVLVVIFSIKLQWLPATGSSGFRYWILPVITLGLQASAAIARMTRSTMLEVIRQDYIRTSRAKGQSEFVTIMRHALRNALVPIVTVIGIRVSDFLAGAVLIETVFAIPGLGKFIFDSVGFRDYPVVQGGVLWMALNCVVVNLIVDIIYCFVDPRIKSKMYTTKKVKKQKVTEVTI